MNLKEYLRLTTKIMIHGDGEFVIQAIRPRIFCIDSASLSVQASENHYSEPRRDGLHDYSAVEVGYPSPEPPELWLEYAERGYDETDYTNTVYPYIPIEMVEDYIAIHGGIDTEKTFEQERVKRYFKELYRKYSNSDELTAPDAVERKDGEES